MTRAKRRCEFCGGHGAEECPQTLDGPPGLHPIPCSLVPADPVPRKSTKRRRYSCEYCDATMQPAERRRCVTRDNDGLERECEPRPYVTKPRRRVVNAPIARARINMAAADDESLDMLDPKDEALIEAAVEKARRAGLAVELVLRVVREVRDA